jgi:hypothetical protein
LAPELLITWLTHLIQMKRREFCAPPWVRLPGIIVLVTQQPKHKSRQVQSETMNSKFVNDLLNSGSAEGSSFLRQRLNQRGCKCQVATSSAEADRLFAGDEFDLVLCTSWMKGLKTLILCTNQGQPLNPGTARRRASSCTSIVVPIGKWEVVKESKGNADSCRLQLKIENFDKPRELMFG